MLNFTQAVDLLPENYWTSGEDAKYLSIRMSMLNAYSFEVKCILKLGLLSGQTLLVIRTQITNESITILPVRTYLERGIQVFSKQIAVPEEESMGKLDKGSIEFLPKRVDIYEDLFNLWYIGIFDLAPEEVRKAVVGFLDEYEQKNMPTLLGRGIKLL